MMIYELDDVERRALLGEVVGESDAVPEDVLDAEYLTEE